MKTPHTKECVEANDRSAREICICLDSEIETFRGEHEAKIITVTYPPSLWTAQERETKHITGIGETAYDVLVKADRTVAALIEALEGVSKQYLQTRDHLRGDHAGQDCPVCNARALLDSLK